MMALKMIPRTLLIAMQMYGQPRDHRRSEQSAKNNNKAPA